MLTPFLHVHQVLSHRLNFQYNHGGGLHLLHRDHLHPLHRGAKEHNSAGTKALRHNRGIKETFFYYSGPGYQRKASTKEKQPQKAHFYQPAPQTGEK